MHDIALPTCPQIAQSLNTLAAFCGVRDLPALTQSSLQASHGITQVDVMVLFGGSILAGGDVFAEAMQAQIAKKYIIVGGAGHTTQTLRDEMHARFPHVCMEADIPEAKLFDLYLKEQYGLAADFLETHSTNCGNNITYLLDLLAEQNIPCHHILLVQDASMQRRMAATLALHAPEMQIINFAAYQAVLQPQGDALVYEREIHGMWDVARYITLLMGEIPRLTDDEHGYGPRGSGFIAHLDIPQRVQQAFALLQIAYTDGVRVANPEYASH